MIIHAMIYLYIFILELFIIMNLIECLDNISFVFDIHVSMRWKMESFGDVTSLSVIQLLCCIMVRMVGPSNNFNFYDH